MQAVVLLFWCTGDREFHMWLLLLLLNTGCIIAHASTTTVARLPFMFLLSRNTWLACSYLPFSDVHVVSSQKVWKTSLKACMSQVFRLVFTGIVRNSWWLAIYMFRMSTHTTLALFLTPNMDLCQVCLGYLTNMETMNTLAVHDCTDHTVLLCAIESYTAMDSPARPPHPHPPVLT